MPWKSDKQRRWGNSPAGIKALGKSGVAEWNNASKGMKLKKKKAKIVVNNKIKAYGQTDTKTNLIEINKKKHHGDKRQLADTIKHEIYHTKHPKAHEKTVYKKTGHIENMSSQEQNKYLAKLRMKGINQKVGAVKRKFKLKGQAKTGDLISEINKRKITRKTNQSIPRKERVSIMGLV